MGRTNGAPDLAGVAACRDQVANLAFTEIVSSDLARASMAAQAIGAARGVPVVIDPRWRELDFGEWDGLAPAQVDAQALGRFWADPESCPPPGGERWSVLVARVSAALDACSARDTLVVTHGGAIRACLAALFGFSPGQTWAFDLPYAALLSLRVWPGASRSAQIGGLWP